MTKQICALLQRWPEPQRLCLVIDNAEGMVSSAANVLVRVYSFSLFLDGATCLLIARLSTKLFWP